MDVWRILTTALRRWYVFIPLLVVSGVVALSAELAAPEYSSEGVVQLVPPQQPVSADGEGIPEVQNPYLSGDVATSLLRYTAGSSAVRQRVVEQGNSPDYTLAAESRSAFLLVSATATSAGQAVSTGNAVIEIVREQLAAVQADAGIPESSRITVEVIDEVDSATSSASSRIQQIVLIGGVGAVVSFLLTVLIDDLLILRRRRAAARSADASEPADSPDDQRSAPAASPSGAGNSIDETVQLPAQNGARIPPRPRPSPQRR